MDPIVYKFNLLITMEAFAARYHAMDHEEYDEDGYTAQDRYEQAINALGDGSFDDEIFADLDNLCDDCMTDHDERECGHVWFCHRDGPIDIDYRCECCMDEYFKSIDPLLYGQNFDPCDILSIYWKYKYESFNWEELIQVATSPQRLEKHLGFYSNLDEALEHF